MSHKLIAYSIFELISRGSFETTFLILGSAKTGTAPDYPLCVALHKWTCRRFQRRWRTLALFTPLKLLLRWVTLFPPCSMSQISSIFVNQESRGHLLPLKQLCVLLVAMCLTFLLSNCWVWAPPNKFSNSGIRKSWTMWVFWRRTLQQRRFM